MSMLGRVLGEGPGGREFIETVPKRGYRFVGLVEERPDFGPAAAVAPPAHDVSAIAVLPFADMSPHRDQDYLCEGLAEELNKLLTQICC